MQKWECYEAKSLSQLNSFYLSSSSSSSGIDLDVVLIEKDFQLLLGTAAGEDHTAAATAGIVTKLRNAHENICVVGFVNNKCELRESEGYDLIISRPLMDEDLVKIFHACDVIAIRSLLWLK
jgi:hypothetical protein